MRFNAIIISALAIASLGVKAAPSTHGDLYARTDDDQDCKWVCTPKPNKPCVEYCIFPGWDCNTGDVSTRCLLVVSQKIMDTDLPR